MGPRNIFSLEAKASLLFINMLPLHFEKAIVQLENFRKKTARHKKSGHRRLAHHTEYPLNTWESTKTERPAKGIIFQIYISENMSNSPL